ncbi:ATP-binding protein [Streptomyces europaeiscabiei]|uniref:ATP-binding protein n=2 Tax=Streptomyces europaeiscabiei TaxID=146819 RepID=A0ABU4NH97_9ACTN|nr:ATP-binding protein [Streptomyces europaeiscabiei]MDX3553859.1 ATP-binding protein [Streptomyces europaeiscabiei]MDX3701977.1 ATP-binding protein [Streptomyces europaeiscabiei]MDX3861404.1 ATP-binding protein [Streptomyces europaeiscabiei]MDX3868827.1 ATP-binding protein [Streptomyces europaeiscabiei]
MQVLQVQLEIRPDPAEVGRARRWARSRLAGSGIGDDEPLAETLILLVSELVTNAVVHTGRPAVLRLLLSGLRDGAIGKVRLEVADTSACPPTPRCADGDETGGRGLALVEVLADRWGWSYEGIGKRIWCELDRVVPGVTGAVGVSGASGGVPGVANGVVAPAVYPACSAVTGVAAVARESLAREGLAYEVV